jgi:hypothetical protein
MAKLGRGPARRPVGGHARTSHVQLFCCAWPGCKPSVRRPRLQPLARRYHREPSEACQGYYDRLLIDGFWSISVHKEKGSFEVRGGGRHISLASP